MCTKEVFALPCSKAFQAQILKHQPNTRAIFIIVKHLVKQWLPSGFKQTIRSAAYAWQLGVFLPYLASLRNSHAVERLGNRYGGWNIPSNSLSEEAVVYCAGCGEDITFDLAVMNRYGCDVHGIDPTPRSIDYVKATTEHVTGYHLHELGLWHEDSVVEFFEPADSQHVSHSLTNLQSTERSIKVNVVRLSSLMRQLQHDALDLLKLDIEGAETVVIDTLLSDELRVSTLCVEFDELLYPDAERIAGIKAAIARLRDAGYRLFWVEASNYTFVLDT